MKEDREDGPSSDPFPLSSLILHPFRIPRGSVRRMGHGPTLYGECERMRVVRRSAAKCRVLPALWQVFVLLGVLPTPSRPALGALREPLHLSERFPTTRWAGSDRPSQTASLASP